jgi:K+-sensing histidine kinase KdpD
MSSPPDPASSSSFAALQHGVQTHLTTIRGQAQLVARGVRQLPEPERAQLLARLQAIDDAVAHIVRQLARWSDPERPD